MSQRLVFAEALHVDPCSTKIQILKILCSLKVRPLPILRLTFEILNQMSRNF